MKKLGFIFLGLSITLTNAFAQAVRVCPQDILTCTLESIQSNGSREIISKTETAYNGTNSDEPSLPPDFCTINVSLQNAHGLSFNVSLNEENQMVNIYLTQSLNYGGILPGDTSFQVKKDSAFYYRYNQNLLTCSLKNHNF